MSVAAARAVDLRLERRIDPIGIDELRPGLSWRLESGLPVRQVAYQVQVAPGPGALRQRGDRSWDSGRTASAASILVPYAGPTLRSREARSWRVRAWLDDGSVTPWSEVAGWEMGLLRRQDWRARWIGYRDAERPSGPDVPEQISPGPLLRRRLPLPSRPRRARLYITALGLYEARINGARVGERRLTPGWTDYHRRVEYQTYDVTSLLGPGSNVLAVALADGWFAGHVAWFGRGRYGDVPALCCQLELELADGERLTVGSDETWQARRGPARIADLIMGERLDRRAEPDGWDRADGPDDGWHPAQRFAGTGAALVASRDEGVVVASEDRPLDVQVRPDGRQIVDVGRNIAGILRLALRGPAGSVVTIRHGEELDRDGRVYTENLRTAEQLDEVTLARASANGDAEVFQPRFTVHGFRYAEVSGGVRALTASDVTVLKLTSAPDIVGTFECSDSLVNALHANVVTSLQANFLAVPTDCPQRDERLGWTGDIAAFAGTALCIADVGQFLARWLVDLEDAQLPSGAYPDFAPRAGEPGAGNSGWADAGLLVPWLLYERTGDRRVLERQYGSMRRFFAFLEADHSDGIRDAGRHGDWVGLGPPTPLDLVGTAHLARCALLFERIAGLLGRHADARRAHRLHTMVRAAFQREFLEGDGRLRGDTQTGYVLALAFALLPAGGIALAGHRLAQLIEEAGCHLQTGFLGIPHVLPVLSEHGHHGLACRLVKQDEHPSWGFQVRRGATSIWERWNGRTAEGDLADPEMNSFNHYAFGSVGEWLHRHLSGLDAVAPGYREVAIRPRPSPGFAWVRAAHRSPYGSHELVWETVGDELRLEMVVPPSTTARVILPRVEPGSMRLGGQRADASAPLVLGPGPHRLTATVTVDG